ncbi:hypothetical protein ACFC60_26345 [Kitasatospora purpeofusca]|uniref:hypothetical protein n=1 Tax=Kitasatospora purpeofusca TaxID=67352 RepID=UPI0035E2EED9
MKGLHPPPSRAFALLQQPHHRRHPGTSTEESTRHLVPAAETPNLCLTCENATITLGKTTASKTAESAGADTFYVADTNSALLPHQVEELFRRLSATVGLPLGFHAHDCKRLALANVLAAQHGGAQWADASLAGLGRGAGNAATEVLHELTGRGSATRNRLLQALPTITRAFEAHDARQLWQQLCAFLDLWPPTVELFEDAAARSGMDLYARVGEGLLGRELNRPPVEADLLALIGLDPNSAK